MDLSVNNINKAKYSTQFAFKGVKGEFNKSNIPHLYKYSKSLDIIINSMIQASV